MAALLAKALAVATIAWGAPCPATDYTTSCTVGTNVYIAPGDGQWINHELGHVFDYAYLTNADRGTFEYLAGLNAPWLGGGNSPAEQFAEAFRSCAHSPRWPPRFVYENYYPTVRAHRRVCRWMVGLRSPAPSPAGSPG